MAVAELLQWDPGAEQGQLPSQSGNSLKNEPEMKLIFCFTRMGLCCKTTLQPRGLWPEDSRTPFLIGWKKGPNQKNTFPPAHPGGSLHCWTWPPPDQDPRESLQYQTKRCHNLVLGWVTGKILCWWCPTWCCCQLVNGNVYLPGQTPEVHKCSC